MSNQEKSAIAFLPIKPRFAEKIISGEKKFEYRRLNIAIPVSFIIIYSSSPTKRIIGFADVSKISRLTPRSAWKMTSHAAGIDKAEFDKYFEDRADAFVIQFNKIYKLTLPLKPNDIRRGFRIPQSFRYVDNDFFLSILEKGF